jgi:hypothetical protein
MPVGSVVAIGGEGLANLPSNFALAISLPQAIIRALTEKSFSCIQQWNIEKLPS